MDELVFDNVLKRMGAIASAVNAFNSEAVQVEAFAALVDALGVGHSAFPEGRRIPAERPATHQGAGSSDLGSTNKPKGARTQTTRSEIMKDLNLQPAGALTFAEFVAQKQPKTNEEKYAVVVYYLEQILKLPAVNVSHVATAFKMTPTWREPENVAAGLRKTAERKATIDTGDLNALKTTPHGRNFVEHDLPRKDAARE